MEGPKATVIVRLERDRARRDFGASDLRDPPGDAAGRRRRGRSALPMKSRSRGVAYAFRPGRRIRLAISTTYWPMVWPEREAGAITIYPDATALVFPGMPAEAVHDLAPFGPADLRGADPVRGHRAGDITRTVTWDATTGESTLTSANQRKDLAAWRTHARRTRRAWLFDPPRRPEFGQGLFREHAAIRAARLGDPAGSAQRRVLGRRQAGAGIVLIRRSRTRRACSPGNGATASTTDTAIPARGDKAIVSWWRQASARVVRFSKGLTPYEFICKRWTIEPEKFRLDAIHQMPGLNI